MSKLKHVRETSVSAWRTKEVQAVACSLREQVFRLLEKRPSTGAEIDQQIGTFHGHKRLSELRRDGLIVELDKRKCTVSGHETYEWGVVEGVAYTSSRTPRGKEEKTDHTKGFAQFIEMYKFATVRGYKPRQELIELGRKLREEFGK